MSNCEQIKATMDRAIEAVKMRPSVGQGTEIMQIDLAADGCCAIKEGDQTMTIDLSEEYGGNGTTKSAGYYLCASLGACLAQGYHIWAAMLGVPINSLSIELQYDYDMRGNLGIDKAVPPSFLKVRYIVSIDSPAPRAAIEEVLNRSDDVDWVRDAIARAIPLERELRLTRSEAAG